MTISEYEWEKLNAFVDEELPKEEAVAFEEALLSRPDLQEEHMVLLSIKSGLRNIIDEKCVPIEDSLPFSRQFSGMRKIAAAIAGLMLIGSLYLGWASIGESSKSIALDLHAAFSSKTYILSEAETKHTVSSFRYGDIDIPDLSASALTLADVVAKSVDNKEVIAMHYRGQRGCRLTLVAVDGLDEAANEKFGNMLRRHWQAGSFHFSLIAVGMDKDRFHSIADFVSASTQRSIQKLDSLRMAMKDSYESAFPCA